MKKRILAVTIILLAFATSFGQNSINDYKYVVVPHYYEFLKGKDIYRLNTMTRFLLKKYGFNAYMEEEAKPQDYRRNNCLALRADVINIKAMFTTKVKVVLKNCNNEVVFESREGRSKIKTYEEGYKDALQKAFTSFETIDYQYNPNNAFANNDNSEADSMVNSDEEVKQLRAEIEQLKKEKELEVAKAVEELKVEAEQKQVPETKKKVDAEKFNEREEFGQTKSTQKNQTNNKVKDEKFNVKEEFGPTMAQKRLKNSSSADASSLLYAQELENGYQLVDSTPKIVMILIQTPQEDFFIVKDKNAVVFKENGVWFYSKGEEKKQLNIKF